MAIPSNPSRSQIYNEFGSSTRSAHISNRSLKDMYGQVQGTSGAGFSRNWFGGKGTPEAETVNPRVITSSSVELRASVATGFVPTHYFFQWRSTTGSTNTEPTRSMGDEPDIVTEEISGLNAFTTYEFRITYWNGFTEEDEETTDWHEFTTNEEDFGDIAWTQNTFSGNIEIETTWTNTDSGTSIELEYKLNGSVYATPSLSAGTTSHTIDGFSEGDTVCVRGRYSGGSYGDEYCRKIIESS